MNTHIRRDFLKTATVATLAAGVLPGMAWSQTATPNKPNVVIMFIDDLGYGDLACFGNPRVLTPHIDSLARNGVKCTMSYIPNPPCSPARCALMTGMYTPRFGKSGMARGLPIPTDKPTLAEIMRDAGYVTGQVGKWDIGSEEQGPQKRGFMEVALMAPGTSHYDITRADGTPGFRAELDGDHMAQFVERNKDKPFFLYFSPLSVHAPFPKTLQHYASRIPDGKGTLHDGAVMALDDQVGKLLAVLKKHNLETNTLVFITGDNGPNLTSGGGGSSAPYRGGKLEGNSIYEGWVHTPAIVSWPGTLPAGTTYGGLMSIQDYFATAVSVAGKPLPQPCDGTDLIPYLKQEKSGDAHEFIFFHNADPTDLPHRNLQAVRWKNWRLVKYPDGWRLFDLVKDPEERTNLVSQHPDVVETMRKQYDGFVATLPPIKPGKDYNGKGGGAGSGWGWLIGKGTTDPMPPAKGNSQD
jgi:arylsulfatase A-like enzyme